MLHTSTVAPRLARLQPDYQESELLDPLLRLAGDVGNARALVVAEHGLDLMCSLIRRGCLTATELRVGAKTEAGDYDLVLLPDATALPSLDDVIQLALRSLAPSGRLVVGVPEGAAAGGLARRLRLNGFRAVRSINRRGMVVLRAARRRHS